MPTVRSRVVGASVVAAVVMAAVVVGSQPDDEPQAQTTVSITFPSSDVFAGDDFHVRRALQGGTLAGSYVAWTEGGQCNVVSFEAAGVGYDPRPWDARLSGCDWAEADLGSSANTATQVGAAFELAATSLGSACSADAGVATCVGGSSPIVGDAMTAAVPATRGMLGFQRNDWGDLDVANNDGAGGGTGIAHFTAPCDGRITGAYTISDGGGDVRLGVANGPAYSATPGALSGGAECVVEGVDGNVLAACAFGEPIAMTSGANMWAAFRDLAEQTIRFRPHGEALEGNGDITVDGRLVFDTAEDDPAVPIFTSGAYTSGATNTYAIYMAVGALFECEDGSGRFAGDGSIDTWAGNLRSSASGGSPTTAAPAATADEITVQRVSLPQWTATDVVAAAYAVQAWDAADDLGLAFYEWNDAALPTATSNPLLRSVGRWGTTGTGWQVHTLSSPLPVGTDTLGASAVLGVGTTFGAIAGGEADTLTIYFDDEDPGGTRTWSTAWDDDGREWVDFLLDAAVPGEFVEYRTFGTDENSAMVAGAPATVWLDPYDPGTVDDRPRNLPRLRIRYQRAGITAQQQ